MSRVAGTIGELAVRRTWRGALVLGLTTVLVSVTAVLGYLAAYPDPADRVTLASSIGSNPGLVALFGEPLQLQTMAGFTEWRVVLLLSVVSAIWALLAVTRLLRGEEESGRAEVLLAGPITRTRATLATLGGATASLVLLLVVSAMGLVISTGYRLGGGHAALLALTAASMAFVMLAVAAITSQVAGTRRQAAGLAAGVLGAWYLVRVVADSSSDLRWARWATPLGWLELAHPLTDPRPLPIVLPYVLAALLALLAVALGRTRDTGAGMLAQRDRTRARTRGLGTPLGVALRTTRGSAWAWAMGLALSGMLIGLVARTAAEAMAKSRGAGLFGELGIEDAGTRAYVGIFYLFITVGLAVAAAGQVSASRDEEASGRLDALLARPVRRTTWLAGRLVTAVALLTIGAAAAVLGTAAAGWAAGLGVAAPDLVLAGVNTLPTAVFVLGAGTLLLGLVPRQAVALTYALVTASFLLEVVGASVNLPTWILDLSVLHHVAPAPAVSPRWGSALVLVLLAAILAGAGAAALRRRDVEPA